VKGENMARGRWVKWKVWVGAAYLLVLAVLLIVALPPWLLAATVVGAWAVRAIDSADEWKGRK
jgi:hypothetical protein